MSGETTLDHAVAGFVASYEFDADECHHVPDEHERALIEDALHGFIADHVAHHRQSFASPAAEREEVAGLIALAGLGTNTGEPRRPHGEWKPEEFTSRIMDIIPTRVVDQCFDLADALLALLAKPPTAEGRSREEPSDAESHFHDGMFYYRGLLDQIAKHIGPEAWRADNGDEMGSVVRARLPDLVSEAVRLAYKTGHNEGYIDATDDGTGNGYPDHQAAEEGWQQYMEARAALGGRL